MPLREEEAAKSHFTEGLFESLPLPRVPFVNASLV
jgi:hypothetical protein